MTSRSLLASESSEIVGSGGIGAVSGTGSGGVGGRAAGVVVDGGGVGFATGGFFPPQATLNARMVNTAQAV
jgi:hypothetical protein